MTPQPTLTKTDYVRRSRLHPDICLYSKGP